MIEAIGHYGQLWSKDLNSCSHISESMEQQANLNVFQTPSDLSNKSSTSSSLVVPNSVQKAEKSKYSHIAWNRGLTNIDERMKKISETRKKLYVEGKIKVWNKGKTHPKYEQYIEKVTNIRKGKTYEEIYGAERAKEMRDKLSETKQRLFSEGKLISPFKNKHHSEDAKQRLRLFNLGKKSPETSKKIKELWSNGKYKKWDEERKNKARERRLKQVFPTKDSKPELKLQEALTKIGITFEKHKAIKGQPDIFFPKEKMAVFVDGCYFHLCKTCKDVRITNQNRNIDRKDKNITEILQSQGYTVLRFWEHEINKNIEMCLNKIKGAI